MNTKNKKQMLYYLLCVLIFVCPTCSSSKKKGTLSDKSKLTRTAKPIQQYNFRVNFKAGETYKYKFSIIQSAIIQDNNTQRNIDLGKMEYIQNMVVTNNKEHNYMMKIIFDKIKLELPPMPISEEYKKNLTEALQGLEMDLIITPKGKVVDAKVKENIYELAADKMGVEDSDFTTTARTMSEKMAQGTKDEFNQIFSFADDKMRKAGDKWSKDTEYTLMNQEVIHITIKYEFKKLNTNKGIQLAYINFTVKKKFPGGFDVSKNLDEKAPSMQKFVSSTKLMDVFMSGTIVFNCNEKAIQKIQHTQIGTLETMGAGTFYIQKMKSTVNYTMTLLGTN